MNMDLEVVATCECGKESYQTTIRKVKNEWPFCGCRQSMRIKHVELSVQARDQRGSRMPSSA